MDPVFVRSCFRLACILEGAEDHKNDGQVGPYGLVDGTGGGGDATPGTGGGTGGGPGAGTPGGVSSFLNVAGREVPVVKVTDMPFWAVASAL